MSLIPSVARFSNKFSCAGWVAYTAAALKPHKEIICNRNFKGGHPNLGWPFSLVRRKGRCVKTQLLKAKISNLNLNATVSHETCGCD